MEFDYFNGISNFGICGVIQVYIRTRVEVYKSKKNPRISSEFPYRHYYIFPHTFQCWNIFWFSSLNTKVYIRIRVKMYEDQQEFSSEFSCSHLYIFHC